MPSRLTTRSGRVVKNSSTNQAKLDAMELLVRQRKGEKVDIGVKLDEPLYEEVNEEEYRASKKHSAFIEHGSDEDEVESDLDDFIDEGDEERDRDEVRSKKDKRGSRKKSFEKNPDPAQRSVKHFLGSSSKSSKVLASSSIEKERPAKEIDEDDILSQMLYDVPKSRAPITQKPIKIPASQQRPVAGPTRTPKLSRSMAQPASVKRPRLSSPSTSHAFDDDNPGLSTSDWPDDFDDSLPEVVSVKNETREGKITSLKSAIELAKQEIYDDENDNSATDNDAGIKVAPLNDDLKSNLDFHDLEDGRKYTQFYWYDCCEDQAKNPGVVYFFGRIYATTIKKFVSCCTIIKNVQRTCYLLINDNCSYEDAVGEFTHITAKKYKIKNFTCTEAEKKYAFSSGEQTKIPLLAKYVRVDYPVNQPALPSDLVGQTFDKVLNYNQSPMEKLILELKLRGPCWFRLIDPAAPTSQLTWTRVELILETPENLQIEPVDKAPKAPYFCAFSLSLRTYPNPVTHQNEIIAIAGMVNSAFNLDQCLKRNNKASGHFLIMTKPAAGHKELKLPYDFQVTMRKYNRTRFQLVESERDLLTNFMEKFENLDPDLVVGHDLLNFDYETLVVRMKHLKVGVWSKLGRFKRTELPSTKAAFRYMFSGRSICDIRTSAMELIHLRSYDLNELTTQVLQKTRLDYNHLAIVEAFKSSETLIKLLNATWDDTDSIFSILVELNVIPLALKITNITGNILSRTLAAGRSERNEYLLLHAFHEDNFICPEKQIGNSFRGGKANNTTGPVDNLQPTRKKAAYSGGLVLEPKTGYYDSCVLLMDFNSLYPSIIQEFNICFSTVKVPELQSGPGAENVELIADVPDDSAASGVLPMQLKNLVERRKQVKRLMGEAKTPEQKLMLDIEQKALKLTANSMYGCLGFEQSRFYAKHLASLVTFKGREILMNTKAAVEQLGYEVIYGDTDSLMINTRLVDYDEVIQRGNAIKAEINRTFKLLEIDIDGVYRPLLLLKKKNYAGTSIKKGPDGKSLIKSIETKGLDTVRRDRAVIAKEAGERVLSMILACDKEIESIVEDIHGYLRVLGDSIRANAIKDEKFLISKQLNRNPEDYRDTKGIGHVSLALRYNQNPKQSKKMKAGDTVEYVICLDDSSESANQRAYSLEELRESSTSGNGKLKLDHEYYLCQQIHPIMTRICDKLPTTNAYTLAEMLAIETSNLLHIRRVESDVIRRDQLVSKGEARFNSCKPLVITCPNCNLPDEITSRTRKAKDSNKLELSLSHCSQCNFRFAMKYKLIIVQVIGLIRGLMMHLFNTKFVCENTECENVTRNALSNLSNNNHSSSGSKSELICEACDSHMLAEMDDKKLDLQLSYYKFLFDIRDQLRQFEESKELAAENLVPDRPPEDLIEMYQECYKEIDYALRNSFVNNVDAYSMFSKICSGRTTQSSEKLLPFC